MIILLLAYLYKFQLKPKLSKLGSILKPPYFFLVPQPAHSKSPPVGETF